MIRARVGALRAASDRPFNLNFFAHRAPDGGDTRAAAQTLRSAYAAHGLPLPEVLPATGREAPFDPFGARQLDLVLELRPPVATFHFGLPGADAVRAMKAAGIVLGATATTVAEAVQVEAAGLDFVVAQGFEAGGHRGAWRETMPHEGVGTLALVPQVVDAVSLPVVAAGGIGDARGIVAALALGAAGVQMGTAFLRCPEAETPAATRARLEDASDTDTVVTALVSGRANRVAGRAWQTLPADAHLPFPLQYALSHPLAECAPDAFGTAQYGQAAALARPVDAETLVGDLVTETRTLIGRWRPIEV
mgnify:CR=1 FL=1